MGLLSTPRLDPEDPRCQTDAYIAVNRRLYEVLGPEASGRLGVRNCKTEYPTTLSPQDVAASLLVRAAPVVTIPEGWGVLPQPVPPAQVESD